MSFLTKLLSLGEGKQMARYQKQVDRINALEPEMMAKSDEELAALTPAFRERLAKGVFGCIQTQLHRCGAVGVPNVCLPFNGNRAAVRKRQLPGNIQHMKLLFR